MKKRLIVFLILLALAAGLTGCGAREGTATQDAPQTAPDGGAPDDDATLRVMASFYPVYALAMCVAHDVPDLALTCMAQPQVGCPRAYQLSDWDAGLLGAQDVVVIAGRGFEPFQTALTAQQDGPAVMILMSGLTLSGDGVVNDESTHWEGEDPWLFMSPDGARDMIISLGTGLPSLDPDHAAQYAHNMDDALLRLDALEADMRAATAACRGGKVAILHEGLRYFSDWLGLETCATFPREPGTEQVEADLEALFSALDGSGARVVLIEKQAPQNLVEALQARGYAVARIDTLMTHAPDGSARAYYDIMLGNAQAGAAAFAEDIPSDNETEAEQ